MRPRIRAERRLSATDTCAVCVGRPAQIVPFGTRGSAVCTSSCQAHLELGLPPDWVVHLTHGQAEPVPEKPEPFRASPGDQFFDALWLVFGMWGVHDSSVSSGGVGQVNGARGSCVLEQNVLGGCRGPC